MWNIKVAGLHQDKKTFIWEDFPKVDEKEKLNYEYNVEYPKSDFIKS